MGVIGEENVSKFAVLRRLLTTPVLEGHANAKFPIRSRCSFTFPRAFASTTLAFSTRWPSVDTEAFLQIIYSAESCELVDHMLLLFVR